MKLIRRGFYTLISGIILLNSCQSDPGKPPERKAASDNADAGQKTLVLPWTVEMNESTQLMEIRKNPAADISNLSPRDMVDALNIKYPKTKLEWVKQEGNKAFVKIVDATFLTQESGSEGAQAYLAEATFALTELEGITAVDFSFKEGDHAAPGTYTRDNFKNFN